MASIVGHGLAGIISRQCIKTSLSARKERTLFGLSVLAALIPDFDVIVFILFNPAGMSPHRGISHSLLFVTGAALFLTIATIRFFPISKPRLFAVYFFPLLSHLVLDYLMGAGPPVKFFAPFSDRGFLSPVKLIPCAFYSTSIRGLVGLMTHIPTLVGISLELLMFVPLIVFLRLSGDDQKTRAIKTGCLLAVSIALLLTCYLYNVGIFRNL